QPQRGARPPKQPGEDPVVMIVMAMCLGVFGIPYSVVMAIGARKMRHLTSRAWAMTSAVLGIAAIVLFGLFGVFHIAAGVWGLIALSDANVSEAFEYRRRRGSDWDDYDDEDDDYD